MAKKKAEKRDGVYSRPDRKGFWISWVDAQDRRRRRKTDANNITQAKEILAAELLNLINHCPTWLRPIVVLGVATGLRRGNIISLRWTQYDVRRGLLIVSKTKNAQTVMVHLNEIGILGLEMAGAYYGTGQIGRVFPGVTDDQVSMAFRRACKKAKIEDFCFHDLRHTHASWLRMNGADIHTVQQLLGHKDIRMTTRYAHLSPGFLAGASSLING